MLIEIRKIANTTYPTTEVLIGHDLDGPHGIWCAARLTRVRHDSGFTVSIPGMGGRDLVSLRSYAALVQQVLITAEAWQAEIDAEIAARTAAHDAENQP